MKILMRHSALVALACAGACTTVHSRDPVGSEVHVLEEDEWNGTWVLGNGTSCTLRVLDGSAGLLEMGFVQEEDQRLAAQVLQIQLREHDSWVFASFEDPNHPGLHAWLRVWREEEQLILWVPDAKAIAPVVKRGELPGSVAVQGDVVLEALQAEHLTRLQGEPGLGLFYWDQPLALIRIGKGGG